MVRIIVYKKGHYKGKVGKLDHIKIKNVFIKRMIKKLNGQASGGTCIHNM